MSEGMGLIFESWVKMRLVVINIDVGKVMGVITLYLIC